MATESAVMAVIRASRPSFRNAHDKVAFVVHSSFLAAGFSLTATGRKAVSDNPPTDGEVGIEGWNEMEDIYGFVYTKTEKGVKKVVLVKCLAIGDSLMIDVLNLGEQKKEPFHVQINVKKYVPDEGDDHVCNYGEMYRDFKGLLESLNEGIFSKLEPKVESSRSASGAERSGRCTTNEPAGRSSVERQGPQPHVHGLVFPPIPPFGGSDLFPGAGAGVYPNRGSGIGGGMLVGPNDPRWFGVDPGTGFSGGMQGVPPGARFDPYGPPDVPGFEPGRFIRNPRRPSGGTHSDLEHFQGPEYI